jgi:hypothetical protein
MSEILMFQAILFVCGTTAFVASLRFLRRYLELRQERPDSGAMDGLHQRLERIEQAAETTAIEVERLSEANRFMARLLADRVGVSYPVTRPERVVTPH